MYINEVLIELKALSNPAHFAQLERFGIENSHALGIRIPELRLLSKKIGKNHELALELWKTGIHEAKILASFIDDPKKVTEQQFDAWVYDFDSWDICDQCCGLLIKTPYAHSKIFSYSTANEEFVKRTAFVLICALVFYDKKAVNESFYPYFELFERESWDNRNFVRKAVNWALRQIGKRNEVLRLKAIECANRIQLQDSKSARWIAADALRELKSEQVINRLKNK
ncbi:MAG: DNA alkylation repair protein [Paludibacter sp.]